jgi:hypothetical protein
VPPSINKHSGQSTTGIPQQQQQQQQQQQHEI